MKEISSTLEVLYRKAGLHPPDEFKLKKIEQNIHSFSYNAYGPFASEFLYFFHHSKNLKCENLFRQSGRTTRALLEAINISIHCDLSVLYTDTYILFYDTDLNYLFDQLDLVILDVEKKLFYKIITFKERSSNKIMKVAILAEDPKTRRPITLSRGHSIGIPNYLRDSINKAEDFQILEEEKATVENLIDLMPLMSEEAQANLVTLLPMLV